jgi:hypothetical protein
MRTVSFYHKESGILHGLQLTASDDDVVDKNTPSGHVAIDGHHDQRKLKVDIATGKLVPHTAPADPEMQDRERRAWARARIRSLEEQSLRLVRKHTLGDPRAFEQLQAVDAEITKLEKDLA